MPGPKAAINLFRTDALVINPTLLLKCLERGREREECYLTDGLRKCGTANSL